MSLNSFYKIVGVHKQALHKALNRRIVRSHQLSVVEDTVVKERIKHPTLALRSIYYKNRPCGIGRDRFEMFAKDLGYGVKKSSYRPRTTDSSGVKRFENKLQDLNLTQIDQAWSSDITYYWVNDRFYFITFILDCFSRRIVGYSVSGSMLTSDTSVPAFKRAIECRKGILPSSMIFHSDGGGQYYADNFLGLTGKYNIVNSMCEMAYENGKAERINGVIKNNYLRHWEITDFESLKKAVARAVRLYNTDKPHKALKYLSPVQFEQEHLYLQQGKKPMMTKSFDAKTKIIGASSPELS